MAFWDLFLDKHKFDVWMKIEKEIMGFLNGKGIIDSVSLARIESDLEKESFAVFNSTTDNEYNINGFMDFIFSKSSILKKFAHVFNVDGTNFDDTYVSIVLKEYNDIFTEKLCYLMNKLRNLANYYKNLVQIGRTHSVHAEPVSFGAGFVICWSSLDKLFNFFQQVRSRVEAVVVDRGGFYGFGEYDGLQEHLSNKFGLTYWNSNFERFPREKYMVLLSIFNSFAQVINKLAMDLYFMSSDEIGEVRFSEKAKFSYEKIEIESKLLNSYCNGFSGMSCDDSKPSNLKKERMRFYLFECCRCATTIVDEMVLILDGLEVLEDNIKGNLDLSKKNIYSQAVMLHILKQGKFTRQEVLEDMKILFSRVTDGTPGFYRELLNSPKYGSMFSKETLDKIFSPGSYLSHIDDIYKRAFGSNDTLPMMPSATWESWEIERALEKLAERINSKYIERDSAVTVIAFSKSSLVFLGNMVTKFNFPIEVVIFESIDKEFGDGPLGFDANLIWGSDVLIMDYLVTNKRNLNDFIVEFRKVANVKDIGVCSLLKSKTLDMEKIQVDFWGFECEDDVDYFGFGKSNGSGTGLLQIPKIIHSS